MSQQESIIGPISLVVRVVRPSGKPVPEADVKVEWEEAKEAALPEEEMPSSVQPVKKDSFPATQETKSDENGYAVVGVPSGLWSKGTLTVTRRHHGPVVKPGAQFKSGPAVVPVEVGMNLFIIPGQERKEEVRWGAPRIAYLRYQHKKVVGVEVTLVEGGSLGVEHAEIRTRRLSLIPTDPPADAPSASKSGLSEVDEELLYHIAHGDVALTPDTDYEFEHDDSLEDCEAGKCGVVARPATPTAADPPLAAHEGNFDYVPKVEVRNSVVGGLRVLGLANVGNVFGSPPQKFRYGNGFMIHLNPRNVVGVVRLAKRLVSQHRVRALLSVGFIRNYTLKDLQISSEMRSTMHADWSKLKRDAHGRGRAVDVAGMMLDHPKDLRSRDSFWPREEDTNREVAHADPTAVLPGLRNKEYEPERDFLVLPHWGRVPMWVEDQDGRKRRVPADRAPWVGRQFADAFRTDKPSIGRIFYRLEDLDQPADPDAPEKKLQLLEAHTMTPKHYDMARDLFRFVVHFFYEEYSHRNNLLGNLEHLRKERGSSERDKKEAEVDDVAGAPMTIGSVGGFVLHPDVPSAGTRSSHQDHIHANLGHNGPAKADGFQWTEDSAGRARAAGYER